MCREQDEEAASEAPEEEAQSLPKHQTVHKLHVTATSNILALNIRLLETLRLQLTRKSLTRGSSVCRCVPTIVLH